VAYRKFAKELVLHWSTKIGHLNCIFLHTIFIIGCVK